MAAPRHTILLVQATSAAATRSYYDFESKTGALDGVVRIFEEHLKKQNPRAVNITYDVQDLFNFIDTLGDISCLILDPSSGKYEPYPRDYIKQQCYLYLKGASQGAAAGGGDARHGGGGGGGGRRRG